MTHLNNSILILTIVKSDATNLTIMDDLGLNVVSESSANKWTTNPLLILNQKLSTVFIRQ